MWRRSHASANVAHIYYYRAERKRGLLRYPRGSPAVALSGSYNHVTEVHATNLGSCWPNAVRGLNGTGEEEIDLMSVPEPAWELSTDWHRGCAVWLPVLNATGTD
jgi:hypothetical protein